jgi:hypothetical protein
MVAASPRILGLLCDLLRAASVSVFCDLGCFGRCCANITGEARRLQAPGARVDGVEPGRKRQAQSENDRWSRQQERRSGTVVSGRLPRGFASRKIGRGRRHLAVQDTGDSGVGRPAISFRFSARRWPLLRPLFAVVGLLLSFRLRWS